MILGRCQTSLVLFVFCQFVRGELSYVYEAFRGLKHISDWPRFLVRRSQVAFLSSSFAPSRTSYHRLRKLVRFSFGEALISLMVDRTTFLSFHLYHHRTQFSSSMFCYYRRFSVISRVGFQGYLANCYFVSVIALRGQILKRYDVPAGSLEIYIVFSHHSAKSFISPMLHLNYIGKHSLRALISSFVGFLISHYFVLIQVIFLPSLLTFLQLFWHFCSWVKFGRTYRYERRR